MTKYQEALDRYVNDDYEELQEQFGDSPSTILHTTVKEQQEWDCLLIQEAVDKAIIYDDKERGIYVKYTTTGISYCGNCKNTTLHNYLGNKMIYCSKCGYKIIWRKEK